MRRELAGATRIAPGPQPWISPYTGRHIPGWKPGFNRAYIRRRTKLRDNMERRRFQSERDKEIRLRFPRTRPEHKVIAKVRM
jgi:hypothetical protein